ncbi:maleylpyruvate isomerase family mycothiol-dependent enzyme [Tessaracoccus sp. G1721]
MRATDTSLPGHGATKDETMTESGSAPRGDDDATGLLVRAVDIPLPGPGEGLRVGRAQHLRLIDEVRGLAPEQWATVTECPAWTVRDMVGHVASAARFPGNPLLYVVDAQIGRFRYRGRSSLDAANEVGIDRHRALSTDELLERIRRRAMSGRDTPGWMRRRLTNDAALPSYTTIGSFVDTILTRDTWLHRQDIARAVGREPASDPTDAEVVEQVIRDLGLAWTGPAVVLRLTGPAGGAWLLGPDAGAGSVPARADDTPSEVVLPAVEFMRHLSGRSVAAGLFDGVAAELRPAVEAARTPF